MRLYENKCNHVKNEGSEDPKVWKYYSSGDLEHIGIPVFMSCMFQVHEGIL